MNAERSLGKGALKGAGGRAVLDLMCRGVVRSLNEEPGLSKPGPGGLGSLWGGRLRRAGPCVDLDFLCQCHRVILAVREGLEIFLIPLLEGRFGGLGQSNGRGMLWRVGEALDLVELITQSVDLLGKCDDLLFRIREVLEVSEAVVIVVRFVGGRARAFDLFLVFLDLFLVLLVDRAEFELERGRD